MILRPKQQAIKDGIYAEWSRGVRNVAAVSPTGSGKTVLFSSIIADEPGASIVIAHRKELVSQTSLALVRNQIRHRVIGQKDLVKWCCQQSVRESGHNYIDSRAKCAAAGVDTLIGMEGIEAWAQTVKLWVTDECFPAGTLVDGKPIETLRVGDLVTAFDEKTGAFHKRPILRTFKSPEPPRILRIEYVSTELRTLLCTEGHPFWTKRGWRAAAELNWYDHVLAVGWGWAPVSRVSLGLPAAIGPVYNIEVEEFHTYLANGVVVHNCHHLQASNKWGRAVAMFPNARGLGVTATLERADGRGLGRPDGLLDSIVVGAPMRELINDGHLCDFRVFAPPSDIDLSAVPLAAGGDFSLEPLRAAVHKSHIVGDVVQHYLRFTPGQLGVTFCVDVESAVESAKAFRAAGVPAEVVTGKTPTEVRSNLMRRFARGDFKQLCVVDIVSEGTDIPAIDVVSLARPSESYTLVVQQVGRALRTRDGKTIATVIDHVGNVRRFARAAVDPFDGKVKIELDRETWTLDRRERRSRGKQAGVETIRTCPQCLQDYPAIQGRICPACGHFKPAAERSAPEQVDGNLSELSPESLLGLKREIERIDGAAYFPAGATREVLGAIAKRHRERQDAQTALRAAMARWGGLQTARGLDPAQQQQMFYYAFGVDVATAQTLGRPEAAALELRVLGALA